MSDETRMIWSWREGTDEEFARRGNLIGIGRIAIWLVDDCAIPRRLEILAI